MEVAFNERAINVPRNFAGKETDGEFFSGGIRQTKIMQWGHLNGLEISNSLQVLWIQLNSSDHFLTSGILKVIL